MIFISLERSCNTLWDDEKKFPRSQRFDPKKVPRKLSVRSRKMHDNNCHAFSCRAPTIFERSFWGRIFDFFGFFFIIPQSIAKPFQRRKNQIWGPILGRAMSPQSLPNFWVFAPKIQIFRHFIHYLSK